MNTRLQKIIAKLDKTAFDLEQFHPETGNKENLRQIVRRLLHYKSLQEATEYYDLAKQKDTVWDVVYPQIDSGWPTAEDKQRHLEEIKKEYYEQHAKLSNVTDKSILVFRGMGVSAQGLKSLLSGRKGLGKHWTQNLQKAYNFAKNAAETSLIKVIVTAFVRTDDVHVSKSLFLRTKYPGEQEINIRPGSPINVTGIDVIDWGYEGHDLRKGIRPQTKLKLTDLLENTDFSSKKFKASVEKVADTFEEYNLENGNEDKLKFFFYKLINHKLGITYGDIYREVVDKGGTIDEGFEKIKDYLIERYGESDIITKVNFDVIAAIKEQYSVAYRKLESILQTSQLVAYRGMRLDLAEFNVLLDGNFPSRTLGTHWSTDLKIARAYTTLLSTGSNQIGVILTANIDTTNINIPKTLHLSIQYASEKELNLEEFTPIDVTDIQIVSFSPGTPPEQKNECYQKLKESGYKTLHYTAKLANLLRTAEQISEYDPTNGNQKKISKVIFGRLKLGGHDKADLYLTEVARKKYKTAFPAQPEMWYESATDKLSAYYNEYKEAYAKLKKTIKGGKVKIWRAMEVNSEFLTTLAKGNQTLGIYWSWQESAAHVFAEHTKERTGPIPIKLEGVVAADDVLWGTSIYYNMHPDFDTECEIRLTTGAPITLVNVDVNLKNVEPIDQPDLITKKVPFNKKDFDSFIGAVGDDLSKLERLSRSIQYGVTGIRGTEEKFWEAVGDYFFKHIDFKEIDRYGLIPWFYSRWYKLSGNVVSTTSGLDNATMIKEMTSNKAPFFEYSFDLFYRNLRYTSEMSFMRKYFNGFIDHVKNTPELLHLLDKEVTILDPKVYKFKGKKYKA